MPRKTSVLLGLAVLLSLLFPVRALLRESGVDPLALHLRYLDLAALCAVIAVLPSMALFRHAQLEQRIPRWSVWVALLALCSLVFLALHVSWSFRLIATTLRETIAPDGSFPLAIPYLKLLKAAEFVARLGVLVGAVGVLLNLDAPPQEGSPPPRMPRRKKE